MGVDVGDVVVVGDNEGNCGGEISTVNSFLGRPSVFLFLVSVSLLKKMKGEGQSFFRKRMDFSNSILENGVVGGGVIVWVVGWMNYIFVVSAVDT